ncbi:hypothetical protein AXF21_02260 [Eubacterium minutum ATCC 700079]|nr:hypothetical protein AXF21_02260 [Eubacterium minutum ATCC 700079]
MRTFCNENPGKACVHTVFYNILQIKKSRKKVLTMKKADGKILTVRKKRTGVLRKRPRTLKTS